MMFLSLKWTVSIFSTEIKGSIYRTNEMHFEGFLFQTFQEIICLENKMKDLKPLPWILEGCNKVINVGPRNSWISVLGQWFKPPPRVKNILQTTFAFKTNKDLNRPERSIHLLIIFSELFFLCLSEHWKCKHYRQSRSDCLQ